MDSFATDLFSKNADYCSIGSLSNVYVTHGFLYLVWQLYKVKRFQHTKSTPSESESLETWRFPIERY